jgi:hypothetical protein
VRLRQRDAVYLEPPADRIITADGREYTLQKYTITSPYYSDEQFWLFAYTDENGELTDRARGELARGFQIMIQVSLWNRTAATQ